MNIKIIDPPKKWPDTNPFLKQIIGKNLKSSLKVGPDLPPLPGNEELSSSLASGVKRAMLIMQAVFAKKG